MATATARRTFCKFTFRISLSLVGYWAECSRGRCELDVNEMRILTTSESSRKPTF
jgi:hypothetical protein